MGNTGGAQTHTLTTTEMPSHDHGVTDPGHKHAVPFYYSNNGSATVGAPLGSNAHAAYVSNSTTGITIQNTGGGGAHNNMQPYVVVNFIIKT